MADGKDTPNWNLKTRDRYILSELSGDPTLSAKELRDILDEKYDIDISRVTVSESIRQMRNEGVSRNAIIPNEEYLFFTLFEYKFFPPNFADRWRDVLEFIRSSKHTLLFFLADGEYQWKSVMIFQDIDQHSQWIHNFYKEHGDLIIDLRNTVVTNVLKFGADPEVFETIVRD
jgi:DNA-binding Lrp family transcriptional regulator